MKKILKKLKKLNVKTNRLNSIELFSDGSGFILDETNSIIFEFFKHKELKKYLKTL